MLAKLQQQLHDTYQTDHDLDVRDFLITDPCLAKALGGNSVLMNNGESLLIREEDDGVSLSLYIENEILDRLESTDPLTTLEPGQLDDFCKVIEGVSHFNYVVWRASRDRSMTLLELEMQAEIDKFVSTMQLADEQQDAELMNALHSLLFDGVRFSAGLDGEQAERYRTANELAGRFCRRLRHRLLGNSDGALPELRRFYRLPLQDKISHIHSKAWGSD
jgi:hypothetical protein